MRFLSTMTVVALGITLPGSGAMRPERVDIIAPCEAAEGGNACTNMLQPRWKENLALTSEAVLAMAGDGYVVPTTRRKSSRWCRSSSDEEVRPVFVNYKVPKDLQRFPDRGTANRDFVIAIFDSEADEECWESLYGIRKKTSEWRRISQFVTVNFTRVPTAPGARRDKDERLGRWISWAISSKERPGQERPELRLERLESGKWVACKDDHDPTKIAGFLGCKGLRYLHALHDRGSLGGRTIDEAILRYTSGDAELTRLMREGGYRSFTDEAWGQCGNMGCCALEN